MMRARSVLTLATAGVLVVASAADARITRLQITTKQSPTFGGHSFPGVGPYEKIAGKAAMVEVKVGKGRLILFGFRPQYRAQSLATYPFIFNAIR